MKTLTALVFLGLAIVALGSRRKHEYQGRSALSADDIESYLESKYLEDVIYDDENPQDDEEEEDETYADFGDVERSRDPRARLGWRPRIGGIIKRNIIIRALKPSCAGCAGICERKVPGRCACRLDRHCWRQRMIGK